MANSAIFIGWAEPREGRESQAAALFGATLEFYQTKVNDGTLESFEPVILARHGGDMNGFILLKGDQDKLNEFRQSDEYLDWMIKATYCLQQFGAIEGYIGTGLQEMMARWMKSISD